MKGGCWTKGGSSKAMRTSCMRTLKRRHLFMQKKIFILKTPNPTETTWLRSENNAVVHGRVLDIEIDKRHVKLLRNAKAQKIFRQCGVRACDSCQRQACDHVWWGAWFRKVLPNLAKAHELIVANDKSHTFRAAVSSQPF